MAVECLRQLPVIEFRWIESFGADWWAEGHMSGKSVETALHRIVHIEQFAQRSADHELPCGCDEEGAFIVIWKFTRVDRESRHDGG